MSNQRFFNIGLPQLPLNSDPKIEPDLRDIYSAIRNLNYFLGQYGGFETPEVSYRNQAGALYTGGYYKRRFYCAALENINYGALVCIGTLGGSSFGAYNANATNSTRPCYGICNTAGTTAAGSLVEVVLPTCLVSSIGGLVAGTRYFLSTVNGTLTNVAPAVAGNIHQAIGVALDTKVLFFNPNYDWYVV